MEQRPLTTWHDWYRFAVTILDLPHGEAVSYANARHLEDQNRARLQQRRAA